MIEMAALRKTTKKKDMNLREMKSHENLIWYLLRAELNSPIISRGLKKYSSKEMWQRQYLNWLSVEEKHG